MRIKLKRGCQRKLVGLSKKNYTWSELASIVGLSEGYLRNEIRGEKVLINQKIYKKLCNLTGINFDYAIQGRLDDHWGRVKGGRNSPRNTKKLSLSVGSNKEDLAEIIGIILGDGHVEKFKKGKKIRCYSVTIAGDYFKDKDYLTNYIPSIFLRVFSEKGSLYFSKISHSGYYKVHGKAIVEFLEKKGVFHGNKIKNNQSIPKWIKSNNKYLKRCLRGLIDTDGSIHRISKNNRNLRIDFTSYIPSLLRDVRESFLKIGFFPSKIICGRHIFLSSKKDLLRYVNVIGFKNKKNLKRFKLLSTNAPVV